MKEASSSPLLLLEEIESNLRSPKDLALFRMALLDADDDDDHDDDDNKPTGLAARLLPLLERSVQDFIDRATQTTTNNASRNLQDDTVVKDLTRLLRLYRRIAQLDPTLNEELGRQGAHRCLSQLMKLDIDSLGCCQEQENNNNLPPHPDNFVEENQDAVMEIQDLAGDIASLCKSSFPLVAMPLNREELRARLPLLFEVKPQQDNDRTSISILIHQVTTRQSAQKDVGFVMWPSAVVLAQWLVDHPQLIQQKENSTTTILELGAGCGLVGLVAAKLLQDERRQTSTTGTQSVILSDFNDVVVENLTRNLALNDLKDIGTAKGLDFFQQDPSLDGWLSMDGERLPPVDLILASDVICQPEDAFAVARTIANALKVGGTAIMVSADSRHRFGVERLEEACQAVQCLSVEKQNVSHLYKDIVIAMSMTSGFVEGMTLTMFTIQKRA
jgi:predicted nicotinamide N-methyase